MINIEYSDGIVIQPLHLFIFLLLKSFLWFYFFSLLQGKGLMNTYWLTCREGPSKKREEIAWFADIEPVFLKNLQTRTDTKTKTKKYAKP